VGLFDLVCVEEVLQAVAALGVDEFAEWSLG
jgi:hypothetical protein